MGFSMRGRRGAASVVAAPTKTSTSESTTKNISNVVINASNSSNSPVTIKPANNNEGGGHDVTIASGFGVSGNGSINLCVDDTPMCKITNTGLEIESAVIKKLEQPISVSSISETIVDVEENFIPSVYVNNTIFVIDAQLELKANETYTGTIYYKNITEKTFIMATGMAEDAFITIGFQFPVNGSVNYKLKTDKDLKRFQIHGNINGSM